MFDGFFPLSFCASLALLVYALFALRRERRRFFTDVVDKALRTSPPEPLDLDAIGRKYKVRAQAAAALVSRVFDRYAEELRAAGDSPRVARRLAEAARVIGRAPSGDDQPAPPGAALLSPPPAAGAGGDGEDDGDGTISQARDLLIGRGLLRPVEPEATDRGAAFGPVDGAAPAGAGEHLIGREVGGCRLLRRIGEGGMGVVYLAHHEGLGRRVAVKVLRESLDGAGAVPLARFQREARTAARLDDPRIVRVLHVGRDGALCYIIMEHVAGQNLDRLARSAPGGRLGAGQATAILEEIARALVTLHGAGIVHRDIKPQNVIVGADGRVVVSDFGLARVRDEWSALTRTGQVLGTPDYMAPEQCQGAEADERSDLYALGGAYFFMLTGAPPFTAATPLAVMYQHLHDPAPPPSARAPGVPPHCDALAARLLKKAPADRFQSAREVVEAVAARAVASLVEPGP
ncbi:MAG: serine/threonine protein kinase [Planctomycetes bacterium]|nr:serine/threonine protein kinase [Planctomycetota bacterium]